MSRLLSRFRQDEAGATAVEYALIASGIFLAITTVVFSVGTTVAGNFEKVLAGFK
ncbi:MAG: Flp family type IVb pilin [Variibacter sp.]